MINHILLAVGILCAFVLLTGGISLLFDWRMRRLFPRRPQQD